MVSQTRRVRKGTEEASLAAGVPLVEQTYVGPGIEDNWTALFDTIALFRKVAMEVADHLGYQYPRELNDRVVVYLRSVRALHQTE